MRNVLKSQNFYTFLKKTVQTPKKCKTSFKFYSKMFQNFNSTQTAPKIL